jgi:large repetitive protein
VDANGIDIVSPLTVSSATIKDAAGNDATLTFSFANPSGVKVGANNVAILTVTPPSDGTYKIGDHLDFKIKYASVVNVVTAGGTPKIVLTIGSASKDALYDSGTASDTLTFRYTVASGDLDTDGIHFDSPIVLSGGTIKDGSSVDGATAFTGGDLANVKVDGVAPTITSLTTPSATYKIGDNVDFTATFSESVTVTGSPTLPISVGSTGRDAVYQSGSPGTAIVFRYTAEAGVSDPVGIMVGTAVVLNGGTIKDAAGNDAALGVTFTNPSGAKVDGSAPTLSISAPSASVTTTDPVTYTITYSGADNVTLANGNVTVNGATASATATVTGSGNTTRTVTLSGFTGHGPLGITIAAGTASDTAGNTAAGAGPSATFILNRAPLAVADAVTRPSGQSVKIPASTLLANDSDADGDTLTLATFDATSAHGTIKRTGPWLVYTPTGGDVDDSFTYTVSDGRGGTDTGIVQVTVSTPGNTSGPQTKNVLGITPSGSDYIISFVGIPTLTYSVQYTTDLVTPVWTTLGPATAQADGTFSYTDVNPPPPSRFYRATYP